MGEQLGALHGVRVIDAATLAAGPLVATAMGEFGAEVIKVEQPGAGDPLRTWGDRKDDVGLVWKSMSRNKRCVTLDFRQAEGQELFHQLLEVSDVLVVNNRPSALTKWGIDYESVHRRHPNVVMLHVSGFGQREEMVEARSGREVEHTIGMVRGGVIYARATSRRGDGFSELGELRGKAHFGEAQENKAEYGL